MTDEETTSTPPGDARTGDAAERRARSGISAPVGAFSNPRTAVSRRIPDRGTAAANERRFNREAVHPQPGFTPGE